MATTSVITCPECRKKFKGRADLQGKKIRCPFCTKPFVVPHEGGDDPETAITVAPKTPVAGGKTAPAAKGAAPAAKAAKPGPAAKAAPPPGQRVTWDEED